MVIVECSHGRFRQNFGGTCAERRRPSRASWAGMVTSHALHHLEVVDRRARALRLISRVHTARYHTGEILPVAPRPLWLECGLPLPAPAG